MDSRVEALIQNPNQLPTIGRYLLEGTALPAVCELNLQIILGYLLKGQGPQLRLAYVCDITLLCIPVCERNVVPVVKMAIALNTVFILSLGFLKPLLLLIEWTNYCGSFIFL